jgi:hypothetical protein
MGSRPVTCTATLAGEKGEHYFVLPVDIHAAFGRHRPPVRVTIRGVTFRTTPARYGTDYYIVVNRAVREATGLAHGARVRIRLELDDQPRVVEPPLELSASLAGSADARALYEKLSYSHQKAYADWVADAKRPETRARRAAASVERLLNGRKEPNG